LEDVRTLFPMALHDLSPLLALLSHQLFAADICVKVPMTFRDV
jgi:hypothetical protein